MNFILDIGNTCTKAALFEGNEKIISLRIKHFRWEKIQQTFDPYLAKIDKAIISAVRTIPEYIIDLATVGIPYVHFLSHKSKIPFRNEYETPETLGTDRLAAVAGAVLLYPGEDVLIIDSGSAITYDYLSENTFKGGNISPGLGMRFKALHMFTGKLPLASTTDKYNSPGKTTFEAIGSGVINGVIFEINEYIRAYREQNDKRKVIITGGDSGYLKDRLRYSVIYMPDIVLDGLNYILNCNGE